MGIVVIRVAWVSDDALITLRTALNITHNWGPGFNPTEAVQAYTHPLWFLLWVWIGSWTNQWILGVLALSLVFVLIATALLMRMMTSLGRMVVVLAILLLSNAFIDFTTSGLENPLSYALIAILFTASVSAARSAAPRSSAPPTILWAVAVGLTTAAIILTRLDLALLIAFPLAVMLWQFRREVRLIVVGAVAALIPLVAWFTWSYLTYASLLPNTFAAKTNAQIPQSELLVQGLRYLWVSFENDPVTLIGLAVGLGLGLVIGPRHLRAWSIGTVAYVGYVVWIGGDFMGGRFLAVPLLVAVFVLAASPVRFDATDESSTDSPSSALPAITAALTTVVLLLAATHLSGTKITAIENPQEPRWEVDQNFNAGVADARGSSVADGDDLKGMIDKLSLAFLDPDIAPIGDGTGLGRDLRSLDKAAKNWPTNDGFFTNPSEVGVFCGYLGNIGIATGPITHLIDPCGLSDRFLAETEFVPAEPFAWKPGHFYRPVPEGYVEAVATGDPMKMRDTADAFRLRTLWERIR